MRAAYITGVAICALALAACSTVADQTPESQTTTDLMAGRWILAEPNAPTCGINFSSTPGVQQGPLLPEGGCPEKFFTSKSWALNQGTLTIKDENGEPLAQLTFASGRFDGQSTAGTPVTLSR
jgi:Protease inhibitor Inh